MDDMPIIVAFGGGTNSTAMLCGFRERGIVPTLICFADTGAEMPHTYDHVTEMDAKCREWWGLGIETVQKLYKGEFEGLEGECLRARQLPSLAYGGKHCSVKYKAEPQEKRLRHYMREHHLSDVIKAIGFGADEPWRIKEKFNVVELNRKMRQHSRYYLVQWGWGRAQCIEAIERHGITQPGKSSCFFCPAKKPPEILEIRSTLRPLFERGVRIEENAALGRVSPKRGNSKLGLGLHFGLKWSDIAKADDAQMKLFEWVGNHASPQAPCGCYDG